MLTGWYVSSIIVLVLLINSLSSCKTPIVKNKDYLISFTDTVKEESGYKNQNGKIVIPSGKYLRCFTDTFRTYAIVAKLNSGFVAIDRQKNVLYEVFPFDNDLDEPSDGLFRIILNHKIGYADSATGKIVIPPQFYCAWPFENGVAEVSTDCKTEPDGEHSSWVSDNWFYIDKTGKRVKKPLTTTPK